MHNKPAFLSKHFVICACQEDRFLSPNWIPDVVWDTRGYETEAPSNSDSEDKGGFEDEPEGSHL